MVELWYRLVSPTLLDWWNCGILLLVYPSLWWNCGIDWCPQHCWTGGTVVYFCWCTHHYGGTVVSTGVPNTVGLVELWYTSAGVPITMVELWYRLVSPTLLDWWNCGILL